MTLRNLASTAIALVFLLAFSVVGETLVEKDNYSAQPQTGTSLSSAEASSSIFSLFDPSRLQMHHSYSMAFMSGGGGSQSIAMYLNSIDYELAQPLRLQVDLAYMHQPQTLFGAEGTSGLNGKILPSFRLLWEPSKDFHMSISYETRNAYYNPYYSPYYRGYYNRSLFGR
jgi:hypothetical protein